jgi:hypothetical protein
VRGDLILLAYAWLLAWCFLGPAWLAWLTRRVLRKPRTSKPTGS